ncbi:MAG: hypothetical protein JO138_04905 [Acidobacteriaceae bacterium]|nr:hypothetical protein [Acidobacteriaceae bacterium]
MRLVLQIAGGILLALVFALAVRSLPGAFDESRGSAAYRKLSDLSPRAVVDRCGKPLRDVVEPIAGLRSMYYRAENPSSAITILVFVPDNQTASAWILGSVRAGLSLDDTTGWNKYESSLDKLQALPCLGNRE